MSKLENKILNNLSLIGYDGPLLQKPQFSASIEDGPKNMAYTQLVSFLSDEIRTLLDLDEQVNPISCPEDSTAFVMEITSFLKELGCPYAMLTHGLVSERLENVSDRLLLLDYLITELMGARILRERRPGKKIELKLQETSEAADMREILQTLRFPKPPANISIQTLIQKLCQTIPIVLKKAGVDIVGDGIFKGFLSDIQWDILNNVQKDLNNEYKIRREMLLTRLDVTVQSFQWSNRTKGHDETFENIYHKKRKFLKTEPNVDISDLLAARTEIAIIEKTSNSSVRKNTKSDLNKVIIGRVPDRGGRTSEIAPPPPEMPSWQQRSGAPRGGGNFNRGNGNSNYGRGGGNYQRGGGGRGGYSANKSFDSAGSYSNNYNRREGDNSSDSQQHGRRGGGGSGYYETRRESGGSYSGPSQTSKRAKTYDSFQASKATYADEYVQESQRNQQYQSRGGGRGRSNYRRGQGNSYY